MRLFHLMLHWTCFVVPFQIHPFQGGAYIVKDGMFGVLDQCHCTLEVVFKDGSVCEIEKADPYTLVPVELSKLVEQYELDEGKRRTLQRS